ncbi:hypothetical protein LCGC14_0583420 [marine sediment metagenome]|uniref:Uncharacterized protein n=1 Tax=marine sediment metagenome TaxID=412755 RepID=A0A0F9RZH8_9ZZZZ
MMNYLNGGARPASVRDAKRISDTRCRMQGGVSVVACGPYTWRRRDGEPAALCGDSNSARDAQRLLQAGRWAGEVGHVRGHAATVCRSTSGAGVWSPNGRLPPPRCVAVPGARVYRTSVWTIQN